MKVHGYKVQWAFTKKWGKDLGRVSGNRHKRNGFPAAAQLSTEKWTKWEFTKKYRRSTKSQTVPWKTFWRLSRHPRQRSDQ